MSGCLIFCKAGKSPKWKAQTPSWLTLDILEKIMLNLKDFEKINTKNIFVKYFLNHNSFHFKPIPILALIIRFMPYFIIARKTRIFINNSSVDSNRKKTIIKFSHLSRFWIWSFPDPGKVKKDPSPEMIPAWARASGMFRFLPEALIHSIPWKIVYTYS